MSKRVTASLTVFLLSVWAGVAAYSDPIPRVVDIRVGKHSEYDRLVIQLEKRVNIHTFERVTDGSFILELEALPLLPSQTLATPFKRLGTVQIERTASGTRIHIAAKPRRTRAYLLKSPPRIVVDFADPGSGPFKLPSGVEALTAAQPTPPKPAPEPVPEPASEPVPEPATAGRADAPAPPPPPSKGTAERAVAGTLPAAESPPAGRSQASAPAVVPRAAPRPLPVRPPRPEIARKPPPPRADASERDGLDGLSYLGMSVATLLGLLAIAGLGVALIAWVRMNAARRRALLTRVATAGLGMSVGVETILPGELTGAGDRTDILEKRIDEEVRARMHVEEHVKQLQEEIKVLRDRMHRMGRRSEGDS